MLAEAIDEGRGDVVGGEDVGDGLGDAFGVLGYAVLGLLYGGFIGLSAWGVNTFESMEGGGIAYFSLTAPRYPPSPIEMAPAINSAKPAKITVLVPSVDKPAVRAKGTVRPSDRPMMASDIMRGSTLKLGPLIG